MSRGCFRRALGAERCGTYLVAHSLLTALLCCRSGEFRRARPGERVPYPLFGTMQYVVDAGCYGGRRLLRFEPQTAEDLAEARGEGPTRTVEAARM